VLQDAVQSLQIIRDEAFRCKQITEKLLSLSKPGSDRHEPVSLADLAHDVADMVRAHKAYRDLDLVLDTCADEPLMTRGNEVELKQVLLNLTVNALEAIEPPEGQVRLKGARNNGWVELQVTDNGCGMSDEVKERIFEPFFTSKPGGQRGLGLGLSISHAIVAGHGGAIVAESEGPGRGSRLTLRLPSLDHAGSRGGGRGGNRDETSGGPS
jgi:two-component system, NtrC family, sensor kinase